MRRLLVALTVIALTVASQSSGAEGAEQKEQKKETKSPCSLSLSKGWFPLEQKGSDWWSWTSKRGEVTVSAPKASRLVLHTDLYSLPRPNSVEIDVNGKKIVTVDIKDWQTSLQPILVELEAGTNVIAFVSSKDAMTQAADTRPLAVAVKNMTLNGEGGRACEFKH